MSLAASWTVRPALQRTSLIPQDSDISQVKIFAKNTDNPQISLYSATSDDGFALAEEAANIHKQLRVIRRLAFTASREERRNRRAYRSFLRDRLNMISQSQQALCPDCYGTGDYSDQRSIYRNCRSCNRLNPNYPTHLVSTVWPKRK